MSKPVALTIATSDSGGGAGIQADIKAMEANGVFAASVLAAVTAQNTETVAEAHELPSSLVSTQIDVVAEDLDVQAAKTGMLFTADIIETVAERIERHDLQPLVVDPVMISKSGFKLLKDDAIAPMLEVLMPRAAVVTPNAHEAAHLTSIEIETVEDLRRAGEALYEKGPEAVLVKGGHLSDEEEAVDVLVDSTGVQMFTAPRIDTKHTHGTGCTYASAIAAQLAKGYELGQAVGRAKRYVTGAIRHALPLGKGRGPTNHFFHLDGEAAVQADQVDSAQG